MILVRKYEARDLLSLIIATWVSESEARKEGKVMCEQSASRIEAVRSQVVEKVIIQSSEEDVARSAT
jgi:hypothetical protein